MTFVILPQSMKELGLLRQIVNNIKNYLPTIVSAGNLACGFAAIILISNNQITYAAWLVILAMIFDGLDGQIARLTKTTITWGAHLDTLADLITFGLVPAFLIGKMGVFNNPVAVWCVCFFYTLSATIRLAKFEFTSNSPGSTRSKYFTGLPSTLAGGTIASLILLDSYLKTTLGFQTVATCLPSVIFIVSLLMLSKVPYIRIVDILRRRHSTGSLITVITVFITLLVLFIIYPHIMLALGFSVYILIGIGKHGITRGKPVPST